MGSLIHLTVLLVLGYFVLQFGLGLLATLLGAVWMGLSRLFGGHKPRQW